MKTDKFDLAAGETRLHGLDAVRAFALLLGVILHATMSFLPGPRLWLVDDTASSSVLSLAFFVIHMLRMVTFFLIAGFVARLSLHALGATAFFKDRLRRIDLPLAFGWPLLFPALMAAGGHWKTLQGMALSFTSFPLAHLWFLYLLLLFYLVLALLHVPNWRAGAALDRAMRILLRPWAVPLLAAPLCASLYLHPYWLMWFGIPTPDQSLVPNLPALAGYGGAFAFGWLAQGQPDALNLWRRRWLLNLGIAVACTGACLAVVGATPLLMPVPQGGLKLAYAALYSTAAWSWALALAGIAQRFLAGYSGTRRYLADASYWIYLVHLPLVVALQALVSQWAWPWPPKFLLILVAAFSLMLATYVLLVRGSFIGAVLNGRRKP